MKAGSLCTGYGGLEMGLRAVLPDVELAWVADNDKAASLLLATRYPGVPNLGDITKIDWSTVEKVDILTAGYPCQPFSDAGKRAGEEDPRDLIRYVLKAIRVLQPKIVILENVPGHRRRGFGRVLAGLATMGFRIRWHSVQAAEAGAPSQRERVFISADACGGGWGPGTGLRQGEPQGFGWRRPSDQSGQALPYSVVNGCGEGLAQTGEQWGGSTSTGGSDLDWREYEPAVRRWERITGALVPYPTVIGRRGTPVLSFKFSEWMMGIPKGWVTDITTVRKDQSRLIGNGVCPQQSALAIYGLLAEIS